jgi:hypothetical protein
MALFFLRLKTEKMLHIFRFSTLEHLYGPRQQERKTGAKALITGSYELRVRKWAGMDTERFLRPLGGP